MSTIQYNLSNVDVVAKNLLEHFKWGDVVAVNGAMGYGKTTLISAMIKAFDAKQAPASPTFAIMSVHPLKDSHAFIHIDAYRIKDHQELINLGIDHLDLDHAITFVEWCELIPPEMLLPNKVLTLCLGQGEDERIIQYDAMV
jgi:tRNA threonylcarbamoyladenosine biosynthesis protein TsaE